MSNAGSNLDQQAHTDEPENWQDVVKRLQKPCNKRGMWQVANTITPYIALWVIMYFTWDVSILLTLALAAFNGLFMVRLFIIFHDCGHNSFFTTRKANTVLGYILAPIVFTSFHHWAWEHWRHHGSAGDLDRRGIGDVWTMTVQEYLESSFWTKVRYRLVRNPIFMFTIGPPFMFIIWQRFSNKQCTKQARHSVWTLNVTLLAWAVIGSAIFGILPFIIIQLMIVVVAGTLGVWMFYVQHQFEDVYWARSDDWSAVHAALKGSSFYKLPAVLNWFTGNIGYHHIHHLGPRIPNYYLKRCHESHKIFRDVPTLTLMTSLKSATYRLWDEQLQKLVSYRRLREIRREQKSAS